jgi:hypothetical protein
MNTGEWIGVGIGIAGLVITILGSLFGLAFRMGMLSSDVRENTADIKEIKGTYVVGLKDVNDKLDKVLEAVNSNCERVAKLEGKIDK